MNINVYKKLVSLSFCHERCSATHLADDGSIRYASSKISIAKLPSFYSDQTQGRTFCYLTKEKEMVVSRNEYSLEERRLKGLYAYPAGEQALKKVCAGESPEDISYDDVGFKVDVPYIDYYNKDGMRVCVQTIDIYAKHGAKWHHVDMYSKTKFTGYNDCQTSALQKILRPYYRDQFFESVQQFETNPDRKLSSFKRQCICAMNIFVDTDEYRNYYLIKFLAKALKDSNIKQTLQTQAQQNPAESEQFSQEINEWKNILTGTIQDKAVPLLTELQSLINPTPVRYDDAKTSTGVSE